MVVPQEKPGCSLLIVVVIALLVIGYVAFRIMRMLGLVGV